MSIVAEQLDRLEQLLDGLPPGTNPVAPVKAVFPAWVVTRCEAEDMRDETPFRQLGGYAVFLLDSRDHCWRIIDKPDMATGIILAQ